MGARGGCAGNRWRRTAPTKLGASLAWRWSQRVEWRSGRRPHFLPNWWARNKFLRHLPMRWLFARHLLLVRAGRGGRGLCIRFRLLEMNKNHLNKNKKKRRHFYLRLATKLNRNRLMLRCGCWVSSNCISSATNKQPLVNLFPGARLHLDLSTHREGDSHNAFPLMPSSEHSVPFTLLKIVTVGFWSVVMLRPLECFVKLPIAKTAV